jgi:hypothetical protein
VQIFVFNCANSRLRRYTSGLIYAGSYGKTIFKFNFNTPDWDISPTKTAVFSYRGKNYPEPLDENNMCRVPKEVLYEGYFLVSVQDGRGLLTNNVRVPVAPMPEELVPDTPGGNCDCGPSVVYVPEIDKDKILSWTIKEATADMPVPDPVDLNLADDWVEDETESEYVWEEE